MTAARQQRKRYRLGMLALVGLLSALAALTPLYAAAAERIVVDWHTALAIGGYDPWRSIPTGNRCPAMPTWNL